MKIVNIILAVMFLAFAFVQINDPDPVLWIAIYGSMAVICIMAAFRYFFRIVMLVLLAAFVVYAVILLPGMREWMAQPDRSVLFDDIAKMQHLYIEEAREFLGLMICIAVLLMQLIRVWTLKKAV
ncbi:hypothetical protein KK083_08130 [Fulvivirgaceae bacterium PWU4]|uniref:Transmembrane family 220, helix n=1 Tax=Chryseosolibacter histidini TaxID=2782349 RepID=A0AAP2GNE8_9BACT|nr:transmembrane 220 family protein [Chryseosolibacter histidini]MBT1696835.1 hypothetical protein [Chryseosolibacter histidini]